MSWIKLEDCHIRLSTDDNTILVLRDIVTDESRSVPPLRSVNYTDPCRCVCLSQIGRDK